MILLLALTWIGIFAYLLTRGYSMQESDQETRRGNGREAVTAGGAGVSVSTRQRSKSATTALELC